MGSDVAGVMVNAVFEVLRSVIFTAEVLEFLIEMLWVAAVPTFKSPKSTDDGVATTGLAFVEEKARESEPQPVSPALNRREQARVAIAHALSLLKIDV